MDCTWYREEYANYTNQQLNMKVQREYQFDMTDTRDSSG